MGCNGDVSENKFRKESIDILTRPTNKTTRVLYLCVCVCAGQPSGFIELYTHLVVLQFCGSYIIQNHDDTNFATTPYRLFLPNQVCVYN